MCIIGLMMRIYEKYIYSIWQIENGISHPERREMITMHDK